MLSTWDNYCVVTVIINRTCNRSCTG